MAFDTFLTGIHPRPSELVAATRDMDRGRINNGASPAVSAKASQELAAITNDIGPAHLNNDACAQIRAKCSQELVAAQQEAGFSFVSKGQYLWQDLLRPFSEEVDGIKVGPLTRFFENNTFYKQPLVEGALRGAPDLKNYLVGLPEKTKVVLPAPYTLAALSEDSHYKDFDKLLFACAEAVAKAAQSAEKAGVAQIQFSDHSLAYNAQHKRVDKDGIVRAGEAIAKVTAGLKVATLYHAPQGDFAALLPGVLEFKADALGIDFTFSDLEEIKGNSFSGGVAAGLLNGREALVEEPARLAEEVADVQEAIGAKSVALCPSCEMEYLPYTVALEKIKAIGEAAKIAEGGQ